MVWQALTPCLPCLFGGRNEAQSDEEDNEQTPLFPPPSHVLSPPRRRPGLPPIQAGQSQSIPDPVLDSSTRTNTPARLSAVGRGWSSPGMSSRGRERLGSISRAYQGRMQRLTLHSQPNTPSPDGPLFPHPPSTASSALSAALSPPRHVKFQSLRRTTPSSPVGLGLSHNAHMPDPPDPRAITSSHFQRGHEKRPSVPLTLVGRSVSEPRSLSLMADTDEPFLPVFAHHQMPSSVSGSGLVARGRPRSATTIDRLSPLPRQNRNEEAVSTDEDEDRDADDKGPSHQGRGGTRQTNWRIFVGNHHRRSEEDTENASLERSASVPSEIDRMLQDDDGEIVEQSTRQEERDREVVRVSLGLQGLDTAGSSSSRRGRKAGHGRRGRLTR